MLNNRELATVLAALRYWSVEMKDGPVLPFCDIATCGGELEALGQDEIDALCERLNAIPSGPALYAIEPQRDVYRGTITGAEGWTHFKVCEPGEAEHWALFSMDGADPELIDDFPTEARALAYITLRAGRLVEARP